MDQNKLVNRIKKNSVRHNTGRVPAAGKYSCASCLFVFDLGIVRSRFAK